MKYCCKMVKSGEIFSKQGCHALDSVQQLVNHVTLELFDYDPDDTFIKEGWANDLKVYSQAIAVVCEKRFNWVTMYALYVWIEKDES